VLDSTRREHGERAKVARFAEVQTSRDALALVGYQERVARTVLMLALCERTGSWPYSTVGWWCAPRQCGAWDAWPGGGRASGRASLRLDHLDRERRTAA
jgi:hypothetical protein